MLSMKSVASALVLVASAADMAAPVLVAPAVVLAVSTAARAQEAHTVRQEAVTYRDLNLTSPVGQAAFENRIRHAAQDVCGPSPDRRNFDETADFKACMNRAVSNAVAALPPVQQQAARPSHAG